MRAISRTFGSVVLVSTLLVGGFACGSGDKSDSSSFCRLVKKYQHLGEKDSDFEMETFFDSLDKIVAEFEAAAPPEIKDDVVYSFEAMKASMFKPVDGTDSRSEARKTYDEDEVKAANKRLDKYTEEKCGIKTGS